MGSAALEGGQQKAAGAQCDSIELFDAACGVGSWLAGSQQHLPAQLLQSRIPQTFGHMFEQTQMKCQGGQGSEGKMGNK